MKNLFLVLPVIIFILILSSCKDDSTSSSTQKNVIMSYDKQQKPDTLILTFKYQDTAYTLLDSASLTQYDTIPKVIYEITPASSSGTSGTFILYDNLDSVIFYKYFTGYIGNTVLLNYIPRNYSFRLVNFTGAGSIKVVK